MNLGIITSYDLGLEVGEITDTNGRVYTFNYRDGQNMVYGEDLPTPQPSGRHEQHSGYSLKMPAVGDPVAFSARLDKAKTWSYARHFIDLAERQHGTRFVR